MHASHLLAVIMIGCAVPVASAERPHIILVMADDMGWGETGYRNHPVLKTPQLDAMAANGLRFDRFYSGGPVCSPTRASVLTGRSPDRAGVLRFGYALRHQEKTMSQALRDAGYVTGHFGKWHLDGLKGPGVPILDSDTHHPGVFGFEYWVSVTNFFDLNPLMSRRGVIEEFQGDSSEIAVAQALQFINSQRQGEQPVFAVIWYGTPHAPFRALEEDRVQFDQLDAASANHFGELVALDRSVGTLRNKLRDWNMAENTLLVFCSDNGGLPKIVPETVGGLRGFKGSVYEGGLRVPAIMEWPAVIAAARVTSHPASTMDLFPTIADLLELPANVMLSPVDGISLKPLLHGEIPERTQRIPFRYQDTGALVGQRFKLVCTSVKDRRFQFFDLVADPAESRDISSEHPELLAEFQRQFLAWNDSVDASFQGKDYPEQRVTPADPVPTAWAEDPRYQPYLDAWKSRPEYRQAIRAAGTPTSEKD